jgi:hypothetical protein
MQEVEVRDTAVARAKAAEQEAERKLSTGLSELEAIRQITKRQLALMRWQHAAAAIGSEGAVSLIRLPVVKQEAPQPVLQQVSQHITH